MDFLRQVRATLSGEPPPDDGFEECFVVGKISVWVKKGHGFGRPYPITTLKLIRLPSSDNQQEPSVQFEEWRKTTSEGHLMDIFASNQWKRVPDGCVEVGEVDGYLIVSIDADAANAYWFANGPLSRKPSSPDEVLALAPRKNFNVGDMVDVLDSVPLWLQGIVIAKTDTDYHIHYHGWPDRYDEWISIQSHRIVP
eukprot:TRINITY_DN12056_c0_g2_i1.p1 TRINITY_DN12056_c0_g2~~TRINITY_DN12056_c0_g2_i1.p1  ORF type:complete len:196 (+),score=37.05 TRINITY_DN12056_c0_g2_i1:100-687(+)